MTAGPVDGAQRLLVVVGDKLGHGEAALRELVVRQVRRLGLARRQALEDLLRGPRVVVAEDVVDEDVACRLAVSGGRGRHNNPGQHSLTAVVREGGIRGDFGTRRTSRTRPAWREGYVGDSGSVRVASESL